MVTTCCVVGCKTRAKKGNGIGFYKFPKRNLERRRQWIRAVKRPDWAPTEADRVCSLHFVEGRPCHNLKNHPDWVPSIFSFSKKSPETLARNVGRFERSLKRLKRFSTLQDSATFDMQGTATTTANIQGSWMTPVVSQAAAEAIAAYNQGAISRGVNNASEAPVFFLCNQDGVSIGAPSFAVDSGKNKVLLFLNTKMQAAATTSKQTTGAAVKNADAVTPLCGNTESSSVNSSLLSANLTTAGTGQETPTQTQSNPDARRTCSRASDSTLSASEAEDEASNLETPTRPRYAGPSQSRGSQAKAHNALKNRVPVPSILRRAAPKATLHGKKVVLILKSGVAKAPPTGDQATVMMPCTVVATTAQVNPPLRGASSPRRDPPQPSNIDSEATLSASEGEGDDEVPAPHPEERLAPLSTPVKAGVNSSPCKSCQRLQEENKWLRKELALLKQKHAACTPVNPQGTVSNDGQL